MADDKTAENDFASLVAGFEDTNTPYLRHLEARGAKSLGINPTGPEALQTQAEYLHVLGEHQHPLDVLRRISLNPFCAPKDRIAASKALLEYTMAKMPSKLEVSGQGGEAIKVDNAALKNLSTQELDQLIALLDKANAEK